MCGVLLYLAWWVFILHGNPLLIAGLLGRESIRARWILLPKASTTQLSFFLVVSLNKIELPVSRDVTALCGVTVMVNSAFIQVHVIDLLGILTIYKINVCRKMLSFNVFIIYLEGCYNFFKLKAKATLTYLRKINTVMNELLILLIRKKCKNIRAYTSHYNFTKHESLLHILSFWSFIVITICYYIAGETVSLDHAVEPNKEFEYGEFFLACFSLIFTYAGWWVNWYTI